jgi:hypothetical protein
MKTTILAAALLAGTAIPASAHTIWPSLSGMRALLDAGVTRCLDDEALADHIWQKFGDRGGSQSHQSPDPILICHVPADLYEAAMDHLIFRYTDSGGAPTWVESYCEAEAAIPRNKWVCTYNDVTREYR